MRLAGQTAVITGAASGLGHAFAERYLREGARVVIADIAGAETAAASLRSEGRCAGVETDVTSEASVLAMINQTLNVFGRIDILVNNAAISSVLALKPFEETTLEEWSRIFQVNTLGTFICSKAVAPVMRAQKGGRIINMTSGTAFKGTPMMMPYVASKGAIISMTRALSKELGEDNILVNAIAPGFTVTEAMKRNTAFYESARDVAIATRTLKRNASAEDIAGAAVFLASGDSAFITGQILAVDGGSVYH